MKVVVVKQSSRRAPPAMCPWLIDVPTEPPARQTDK
jgi:hypothetical protein